MISEATDFLQTERLTDSDFSNHELALVRNDIQQLQTQIGSLLDRISILEEKSSLPDSQPHQFDRDQPPVTESSLAGELIAEFQESVLDELMNEVLDAKPHSVSNLPEDLHCDDSSVANLTADPACQQIDVDLTNDDDASEIESEVLKRQLHEQLRDAEVEMALERARVFQQRAALEEMKIKMAQDASSASCNSTSTDPETRLKRHIDYLRSFQ